MSPNSCAQRRKVCSESLLASGMLPIRKCGFGPGGRRMRDKPMLESIAKNGDRNSGGIRISLSEQIDDNNFEGQTKCRVHESALKVGAFVHVDNRSAGGFSRPECRSG